MNIIRIDRSTTNTIVYFNYELDIEDEPREFESNIVFADPDISEEDITQAINDKLAEL
jgi:hypothetical protein